MFVQIMFAIIVALTNVKFVTTLSYHRGYDQQFESF